MTYPYAKAPFPAFGGKSAVADLVWSRFGRIRNFIGPSYNGAATILEYYEPFANSIAMLLANPDYDWEAGRWTVKHPPLETINDIDPYIANFWRAVTAEPDKVAHYANWPVHEVDLHARHRWLVAQVDFREQMKNDPDYYDCKIAGWWVWGACLWIGGGWCATEYTPRNGVTIDGSTEERRPAIGNMTGVHRVSFNHNSQTADGDVVEKRPLLGHGGRGVHRPGIEPRPHLSGTGLGINGRRISKQKPMLNGRAGIYVPGEESLQDYFEALSKRTRRVRTLCGDWSRAVTDVVSWNNNSTRGKGAKTAFFFDSPYAVQAGRTEGLYAQDDLQVAHQVREWCLEWVQLSDGFEGYRYNHPKILIALCGYEDEHGPHMPDSWECVAWKAQGGYSNQRKAEKNGNKHKERIWFSPNCLKPREIEIVTDLPLFQFNTTGD